jgi:putative endonuclease
MTAVELGPWGEGVAANYLEQRGWTILGRNVRYAAGEIDLIARRDEVLAFCEVKTRSEAERWGHPARAVGQRKRSAVTRVAREWLLENAHRSRTYRFDIITVVVGPDAPPVVEHIEDAWWGMGCR